MELSTGYRVDPKYWRIVFANNPDFPYGVIRLDTDELGKTFTNIHPMWGELYAPATNGWDGHVDLYEIEIWTEPVSAEEAATEIKRVDEYVKQYGKPAQLHLP